MERSTSFKDFYIGNYGSVFRFARSIMRSETDVEDIVQEGFLRLYKAWGTFSSDDHARAWLFSVTRNLSIDSLKEKERISDRELSLYSSEDFLLEELAVREAARTIETAIAALPAQTGKIVTLAYSGKGNQEIANEMGISINSVKTLKKEAYRKMRTILGEQYLALAIALLFS